MHNALIKKQNKFYIYSLILIAISALLRAGIYIFLIYSKGQQGVSPSDLLYYEALRYHFIDYLWYQSNIPPLSHVLNTIVFFIFKPEIAYGKFIFLILVFVLDIWAMYLLYSAACKFKINRTTAFLVTLFFSISIMPFEIWRFGGLYDHHTIFFVILFIYAISRFYSDANTKNAILISLGGALLIAQSSVSSIVVPIVLVAVVILLNRRLDFRRLVEIMGIVLIGPIVVLFLICSKNYFVGGSFVTSTKSGPAMMMFVRSALGKDNRKIEKLIKDAGAPGWYLECFNNSVLPPFIKQDNPNYRGWLNLARDFGICFPWAPETWVKIREAESWPFDFEPLLVRIRKYDEPFIEKMILADINDMKNRKYLLSGYCPELSPRWIGIYGRVSMRLGRWLFFHEPLIYLKNAILTQGFFFVRGTYFFRRTLYSNKYPSSFSTLHGPMLGEKFFYAITTVFEWIVRLIYILMFVYPIFILKYFLSKKKMLPEKVRNKIVKGYTIFLIVATPAVLNSLMFSVTASVENDRYFVQITPYLMLITGYFITVFLRIFEKHNWCNIEYA